MVDSECVPRDSVGRKIRGRAAMKNERNAEQAIVQDGTEKEGSPLHQVDSEDQSPRLIQETEDENDADGDHPEKRPLQYWDDLRNSGIPFATQQGSAMFRLTDSNGETVRLGHVANVYPYSEILSDGTRTPNESLIYIEAGMFLALKTFNERSPTILPDLPDILGDCNIYLTIDILDTILSPIVACQKALDELNRPEASLEEPFPLSLAGSFRSAVSQPLAILSGVYEVPHVNGQSTSSALDNKDQAPTFTRVVSTNRLDAKAYVLYLKSLGVHHFAVLFVRDAYGNEFNRDLKVEAHESGMHMTSVSYQDGDDGSIDQALEALKSHEHRYIFTVITPSAGTLKYILRQAINLEILGNSNHLWLFSEAVTALLEPGFYKDTLDNSVESDREIASALSGTGLVLLEIPKNDLFDDAMRELGSDNELFDYFVSRHDAPEVFDDFSFNPVPNFYQSLSYDAIMSLGIALCDMTEEFPTGPDIVEAIKATEFVGVSGSVKFDNHTGTRSEKGLNFKVVNLIVDPREESIEYEARTSSLINMMSGKINVVAPFVYSGGSLAPPQLPPVKHDPNLLGNGVRAVGWTLAGLSILLSAGFGIWTRRHRGRNIVRVSQPIFLGLLCAGTALMASAIIPLSLQEPISDRGLDIACMFAPWLFAMGFAAAVASVLCKILRLNKVFTQSAGMHRVEVKAKQFILPFSLYMLTNFAILLSWSLVAPLRWTRVEVMNYDQFGRSFESYGTCYAHQHDGALAFACTLVVINLLVVLFANYQGYQSRHVPSAFNETFYLALSMAGVLEAFLIGIPLVFLARDNPTAMFMIAAVLISWVCLAILLPTFLSRLVVHHRSSTAAVDIASMNRAWNRYDAARNRTSHHEISLESGGSSHGVLPRPSTSTTVEAIRERVAQRSRENPSKDLSSDCLTVEEIRRRAAQKAKKESSQQRNTRTG